MSEHVFSDLQHWGRERKVVSGKFHPNGASAIAEGTDTWAGFTVARTGTGEYTITFNDTFAGLESFTFSLSMSAATGAVFVLGGAYDGVAKTKILTALDEDNTSGVAAAADIAANAANQIDFVAVFRNSANYG